MITATPAVIESITSKRDPQPEFEAIYLLMPTTQNVERIIKDFTNHKQYAAAHLFFTEGKGFRKWFFDLLMIFVIDRALRETL